MFHRQANYNIYISNHDIDIVAIHFVTNFRHRIGHKFCLKVLSEVFLEDKLP